MNILTCSRDPISSFSHFIGAVLAVFGTVAIIIKGIITKVEALNLIGALIFGFSMIALYSASAIYHYVNTEPNKLFRLRKLDHAMIYVLIAGTYTPVLLTAFERPQGLWLTAAIWAIGFTGIILKLCWFKAPRWLSTVFYIAMGWFIVIDLAAVMNYAGSGILLLIGGIFYTIGGVIYAIKKPSINAMWGFHEIFHVFVILGSVCHYFYIYLYML
ncbi:MAG: hemolysin III family protein [Clostridia bacterium]|nr:hemolysin III family protein [Clostridia bacterium]MDD4572150.1 hemolysin III family protein [Clostridia bacterium]